MATMHLLDDEHGNAGTGGITGEMMNDLAQTSKWLRYLGILGMASCAFIVVVLFISLFIMSGINDEGFYLRGVAYLGFLFFMLLFVGAGFMSLLLYRYGNNLKKYTIEKEVRFLEAAIQVNKNLWLTLGLFCMAVFFGLIILGMFVEA